MVEYVDKEGPVLLGFRIHGILPCGGGAGG